MWSAEPAPHVVPAMMATPATMPARGNAAQMYFAFMFTPSVNTGIGDGPTMTAGASGALATAAAANGKGAPAGAGAPSSSMASGQPFSPGRSHGVAGAVRILLAHLARRCVATQLVAVLDGADAALLGDQSATPLRAAPRRGARWRGCCRVRRSVGDAAWRTQLVAVLDGADAAVLGDSGQVGPRWAAVGLDDQQDEQSCRDKRGDDGRPADDRPEPGGGFAGAVGAADSASRRSQGLWW